MWPKNAGRSKNTAEGAGGMSGTENGRRFVPNAALTCVVGIIPSLVMRTARITVRPRRIGITTEAAG